MKHKAFLWGMLLLFAAELAVVLVFAKPWMGGGPRSENDLQAGSTAGSESGSQAGSTAGSKDGSQAGSTAENRSRQDTVAVNEAVQSVQRDWDNLKQHRNETELDYTVVDLEEKVRFRTRAGLSESRNEAILHRDTILDLVTEGRPVGKIIIYNNSNEIIKMEMQKLFGVLLAVMILQAGLCGGCFFYINRVMVKPFRKLERFAQRVAEGNLDLPLEMDRQNLFGAFTEGFDLMRAELKRARIAEAEANAGKKELVAKLSHDIKTPVASIKAAAEVGEALAESGKMRENYLRIVQKADQIDGLVSNLFTVALEELSQLSVNPGDFKSGELEALLQNADYFQKAKIPPIPDCLLYGDLFRLQQVFDNLFANSYKYAGTKIRLSVCMEETCLSVSLEDSGGGVPPEELPFLKEKFRRGSNREGVEGAGLGLFISDYFMKEMKGALSVENGKEGLRVTVRILLSGGI